MQRRIAAIVKTGARDILVKGSPGSRRTAAYVVPLLDRFNTSKLGEPQVLVMAPTVESVDHVSSVFNQYRQKSAVVISATRGVDRQLIAEQLRRGADYVVGTPGRLRWLLDSGFLEQRNLGVVVLENADVLLSSPVVLELIKSRIPDSTQRILIGDTFDDWLEDSLKEIVRKGHSIEVIEDTEKSLETVSSRLVEHVYCRVSVTDESRQLRHFCESANGRVLVFCRSASDLYRVDQDAVFSDWIIISGSMTVAVKNSQLERFRASPRSVLVTDVPHVELKGQTEVSCVVNWGFPKKSADYIDRLGLLTALNAKTGRFLTLLRVKEMQAFSKFRASCGIFFKAAPPVSADDLSLSFAQSLLGMSGSSTKESEDLVRMHGDEFLAGLVSIMESRKTLLEKRSPLSGLPGYVAVLLLDPFLKKVRSYEMAEKMLKSCWSYGHKVDRKECKFGRIALSTKGYVVDVPSDFVQDIIDSKHLIKRNLKALVVPTLPPLVQSDRLFSIKQSAKDKRILAKQQVSRRNIKSR